MAVNMKDVAEYAGLSIGTVSNYITGKTRVSEKKQKLIEEAIEALGYQVNIAARNLRTNSFHMIGVLIPTFHNVYLLRVISIFEELMHEKGFSLLVVSYHNMAEKEKERLQYLAQRVDAIVYVPFYLDEEERQQLENIQKNIPVVTFDEALEGLCCDQVLVNGEEIARKVVLKLLEQGHRNIGMLTGPTGSYTSRQRIRGYYRAFEEKNMSVNEDMILCGDYSRTSGEQLSQMLIEREKDMTALFVTGYRMTLGAISILNQKNMQEKVEVIGYDALDLEHVLSQMIGYVYQPYDKVAENIAELILKRVHKDMEDFPKTVLLDAEIRNTDNR